MKMDYLSIQGVIMDEDMGCTPLKLSCLSPNISHCDRGYAGHTDHGAIG